MNKDFIRTTGKIIKVRKCWWIKVNKKPVRLNGLDGAAFPHIVTVEYEVNGQKYTKKKFLNYNITCPNVGSNVDVYYNRENPKKITFLPFTFRSILEYTIFLLGVIMIFIFLISF